MIEEAIYSILTKEFGEIVYPLFGREIPCLTYKITPISGGVLSESQLEIRAIYKDYDDCLTTGEKVKKLFDFNYKSDKKTINNIEYRSHLTGGGTVFNDEYGAYEHTLFFILKWREIRA